MKTQTTSKPISAGWILIMLTVAATFCTHVYAQEPSRTYTTDAKTQRIRLEGTSTCLTLGVESPNPYVYRLDCTNALLERQRWYVSGDVNTGIRIHPYSRRDLCLDLDALDAGARLILWGCTSRSKWQQWAVIPMETASTSTPPYVMMNVAQMEGRLVDPSAHGTPLVVTRHAAREPTDPNRVPRMVVLLTGDAESSDLAQHWVSEELACYLQTGKHAVGWENFAYCTGGYCTQSISKWCK